MKLNRFRITNYKTVEDSGWVNVDAVTALVGKNESGKTSLLRALSKLNPTDGAQLDPLKDFPRSRYTKDYRTKSWKVIQAEFEIPEDKRAIFASWHPALNSLETITFHKYFEGGLKYSLEPKPEFPEVNIQDWNSFLNSVKTTVERISLNSLTGDPLVIATKVRNDIVAGFATSPPVEQKVKLLKLLLIDELPKLPDPPSSTEFLDQLDKFESIIESSNLENNVVQELEKLLPSFIYFDNYDMINGAIYLPEFVQRIKSNRKEQGTRVQKAIFSQVNADIDDLVALARTAAEQDPNGEQNIAKQNKFRELTIKANSAGESLTRDFNDWWKQGGYRFHYKFSGDYFEIWVSDEIQSAQVELGERSAGFRYFFSFFLLFSVEAKEMHENCILLLDEPGTHLHGTAQMDLIKFFDRLSEENQLIYSTHSPFMVDGERLERARAVTKTSLGTSVSTDIWPTDKDSVFALQGALGYSICQSLFVSKRQILVEGPSDYLLLHAINAQLPEGERLDPRITMIPIGGCSNLVPYASLLLGHDIEFFVILDADAAGKSASQKLLKMLGDQSRISSYGELIGDSSVIELEELMPSAEYLKAVNKSHAEFGIEILLPEDSSSIVAHCKTILREHGHELNKLNVTRELIRRLDLKSDALQKYLLMFGKKAFSKINSVLIKL